MILYYIHRGLILPIDNFFSNNLYMRTIISCYCRFLTEENRYSNSSRYDSVYRSCVVFYTIQSVAVCIAPVLKHRVNGVNRHDACTFNNNSSTIVASDSWFFISMINRLHIVLYHFLY